MKSDPIHLRDSAKLTKQMINAALENVNARREANPFSKLEAAKKAAPPAASDRWQATSHSPQSEKVQRDQSVAHFNNRFGSISFDD